MLGIGNENYNVSQKPRTLVCYICGREYGTQSLPIHLKTCEQRFIAEEQKKPKHLRRPVPTKPKALNGGTVGYGDIEQYNQNAFETYNNDALETCQNCGRTFKPESLIVHLRVCKPDKPFKTLPGFKQDRAKVEKQQGAMSGQSQGGHTRSGYGTSYETPALKRPKTLMCYICGREYGTKSLSIHIKQCKDMFIVQESKKPKGDRRNPPSTPPGLLELLSRENITSEDIQQYNTGAFNKYNYEALVPCPNCARTFKPESLAHHSKACFADRPFKPLGQGGGSEQQQQQGLVPCAQCGRNFASDRIGKHQSVCKGTSKVDFAKTQSPEKSWTKPKQEMAKSTVPEQQDGSKKIKCYVCLKLFQVVVLRSHAVDCSRKNGFSGTIPPLFPDLVKLSDPSDFLIELYHKSLPTQEPEKSEGQYRKQFTPVFEQESAQEPQKSEGHYRKQFTPIVEQDEGTSPFVPALDESIEENDVSGLVPCVKCDRKFGPDRIAKHQKVCKGLKINSVKVDIPKPVVEKKQDTGEVPKWKKQHEEFVKVIQYNKQLKEIEDKGGDIRQLGPPPKASDDHLSACPYCNRKFDPNRIEKHISICQNVINKPKAVPNSQQYNGYAPPTQTQKDFKIRTPQKQQKPVELDRSSEAKRPTSRHYSNTNKSVNQVYSQKVPQKTQGPPTQNIFQAPTQSMVSLKAPLKPQPQRTNNRSQDYDYQQQGNFAGGTSYNQPFNPQSRSAQRTTKQR